MPIVIQPDPTVSITLSPGQVVGWTSDFVGPLPTGTSLHVTVSRDAEGLQAVGTAIIDTQIPTGEFRVMDKSVQTWHNGQFSVPSGQPIHMLLELHEPGTTTPIDSGAGTYTWAPESNVALTAPAAVQGGGLTQEQAQQLQETHDSSFPSQLVDQLTLLPLTSGPTGDFVAAQLPNPTFGVIVRIASVPPELVANTPDGDYWVTSLAVVRVFRGSDLWKRVPIHTSSKLVELLDESIVAGITAITATQWLLNMTVQVTFRAGVTGEVFLMKVP